MMLPTTNGSVTKDQSVAQSAAILIVGEPRGTGDETATPSIDTEASEDEVKAVSDKFGSAEGDSKFTKADNEAAASGIECSTYVPTEELEVNGTELETFPDANSFSQDTAVMEPRRRSARIKKGPANYENQPIVPASQPTSARTELPTSLRPKRKAAADAARIMASRNNSGLITDVLSQPITPEELKGYKGWVEMESEPMFFQAMLHEMSAPNLKITELFSIDEDSLAALSQPVHGLVFLFQYDESAENSAEERDDCPDGLWFANQTTANACATVALMNITMNITSANFGPELQNFKAETASLSSPHRGYHLDTNDFIRCIHNSIARRTQLLTEDLAYKNKAEDWEAEQLKRERALKNARNKKAPAKGRGKAEASAASTSTSKAKKKKKPVSESTSNHYIAYVPYGGKVWELDGLENKPLCLGPYEDENWLQTAIEIVQVRMAAGDFSNTFNLLAVCASSLQDLTDRLATNLAGAHILELQYQDAPDWSHPSPKETLYPEQKLQNLALSWDLVDNIGCSEAFTNRFRAPDFDQEKASTLMVELMAEQQSIENEMSPEIAVRDTALTEWRARQRDYTPVIHRFLLSLAERGVLGQVVKEFGGP